MNNWPVKKLGEVSLINPSKQEVLKLPLNTPVSFVSMASINQTVGTISNIQTKEISEVKNGYTYFANNDILFAKITPCMENGKVAIAQNLQNGIGFGTTEVHVLRSTDQILPEWIYSLLARDQFRKAAEKHMTGSAGQQRVPREFLENVKIPVPPLNIQKKIVERLDAIRKAQELCNQQIQKTEELFESILEKEIMGKLSDWKIQQIRKLAIMVGSGSTPRGGKEVYKNNGTFFVRSQNVLMLNLDFSDIVYIDEETNKKMKRTIVFPKDVLLNITGASIGRVAVFPDYYRTANVNQHVCIIRVNDTVLPEYIAVYLSTKLGQDQIWRMQAGGTRQGLNFEQVKDLKIATPSLQEQQKIVEKLEAVQNYKKLLQKEKTLLKELFDSVLDKSMKGELDN